ncbi:MFS transporter [Aliiglaciecola sp. M165]|uniref:MFS transporter n=1 Tax=Aliiglaciecola sp. M165 TaxID=2593649 RepID=UPI00117F7162|nr:MFS transporter [Aliiglaciecola sp. M165]TRY31756.1 MFS transporter [Aliiglaciecola sp. M165]
MHVPLKEKLGYAMGDVASNFYWRVFDVFLFIFYTDIVGLSPAAVGTMMLVTRLIDAFTDPMMGALADRTKTRFGKFRPYLLWGIIPLAAAGVLTFTVPDLDQDGRLIWAYATYVFMMLAYTFINVPYGALLGVISQDSQQRTALSSFRFIGAFSGGTIVAYITPELVSWYGNGDDAVGWQLTMVTYGVIAAVLFSITFLSCKERVQPIAKETHSVVQDIKDLLHNKPWIVLFSLALIIMLTITIRASVGTFYFKYFVEREDLIGLFTGLYMISLAIGAASTPLLTKLLGKRQLLILLMSLVTVFSVMFYFVEKDQIELIFALQIAIGLCLGPKSPLVFSMYADTADYSELKTGRRSTAMVFAAAAFSQKLGGALAGASIGWVLAAVGYQANVVQTHESNHGIVLLISIIPGVFALLSVFCITLYKLSEQQMVDIHQQLAQQRSTQGA